MKRLIPEMIDGLRYMKRNMEFYRYSGGADAEADFFWPDIDDEDLMSREHFERWYKETWKWIYRELDRLEQEALWFDSIRVYVENNYDEIANKPFLD